MKNKQKPAGSLLYRIVKRCFDIFSSLLLLVFVGIIIIISAVFIKIEDKGPVFYRAIRVGRFGKPFKMLKLRSMKVNAPDIRLADGSTYNGDDDPRVTRFGRFARKTSIDELPQIINVLKGDMSFIGPRPDTMVGFEAYTEEEKHILLVRPGITGYNQAINRNSVLTKEKLKNDVYYVEHLSLWFDIKIVFVTIKTVLFRKNVNRKETETSTNFCANNNYHRKKIMILGASILQLPAIEQAKKMGLDVVAVDMNPDAIGFKEEGIEKEIISTIDIPKVVEAAKRHKIDGIMTLASDMPMRSVAAVAKEMNLVGIDEQTAINATNKYEMRKTLKKYGVPVPTFFKVSSLDELNNLLPLLPNKYITKPADNSGSRGIYLVDDVSKTVEAFKYSKANSRNGDVIVEEYMEGPEVSVETLTVGGVCHVLQITDKLTTGAPHFVEMGHSQPSQLRKKTLKNIENIAILANKAIGITDGPSHTEIIVTTDGPKVVELGARLGGDCITSHLVPLSTGVNMVECCIKIAIGETPDVKKRYNKGAAIRYINQSSGHIESISGIEMVKEAEGVETVEIMYNVGDYVPNIVDSSSRLGFVICSSKTAKNAIRKCEIALSHISIAYKD